MKYKLYTRIYKEVNKDGDVDRLHEEMPELNRNTIHSIYSQKHQRENKLVIKHIRRNMLRHIKTYESGETLLSISQTLTCSPVLLARLFLKNREKMRRQEVSKAIKDPTLISDEHLRRDVIECISTDTHYSPEAENKKRLIGLEYEQKLRDLLDALNIPYTDEPELRRMGYSKTPDIKLDKPILVDGRIICWIESKATFADAVVYERCDKQLDSYCKSFGPGMVIFWFDSLDSMQSTEELMICTEFPSTSRISTDVAEWLIPVAVEKSEGGQLVDVYAPQFDSRVSPSWSRHSGTDVSALEDSDASEAGESVGSIEDRYTGCSNVARTNLWPKSGSGAVTPTAADIMASCIGLPSSSAEGVVSIGFGFAAEQIDVEKVQPEVVAGSEAGKVKKLIDRFNSGVVMPPEDGSVDTLAGQVSDLRIKTKGKHVTPRKSHSARKHPPRPPTHLQTYDSSFPALSPPPASFRSPQGCTRFRTPQKQTGPTNTAWVSPADSPSWSATTTPSPLRHTRSPWTPLENTRDTPLQPTVRRKNSVKTPKSPAQTPNSNRKRRNLRGRRRKNSHNSRSPKKGSVPRRKDSVTLADFCPKKMSF